MKEIERGIDAPMDLHSGIDAIPIHLASKDSQRYNLSEEIVIQDGDIRSFLTLDRIQKISNRRFVFEVSFAKGPL